MPQPALVALAEADALRSLGLDRRAGLWQVRGLNDARALPLFATLPVQANVADLPHMRLAEHVVADYQAARLSLKAHPLRFLRPELIHEGVRSCAEASVHANGTRVRVAGVVLVRRRPGSAAGGVFATIEDETGIANVVVWPSLIKRDRRALVGSTLLLVDGHIQHSPEGVAHVVADRLIDRSASLRHLEDGVAASTPAALAHADELPAPRSGHPAGHPRQTRTIPPSRNFR